MSRREIGLKEVHPSLFDLTQNIYFNKLAINRKFSNK